MKKLSLLFVVIIVLLSASCDKPIESIMLDQDKFTYYVKTDGKEVEVRYLQDGKLQKVYVKNSEWHTTFDVEKGDKTYIWLFTKEGCTVEFYFGLRGKKKKVLNPYFLDSYHAIELYYTVEW